MKTNKRPLNIKRVAFPAITTVSFFVLFILAYLQVTVNSIEPYYFGGLIFVLPFVCFGIITFFTAKEKLKVSNASLITIVMILLFGITTVISYLVIAIDSSTIQTTNVGRYGRVLKLRDYPNNELIKYFPKRIPDGAENIVFRYNAAFFQGGENFSLRFKSDLDYINSYINDLSQKAKWIGSANDIEAEKNGVFTGTFSTLGYTDLPEDFTIYLIDSRGNWNHGEISLVAISKQRNEIIFVASDW
jgi:hypothetical protein